jgi:hypothetical protein
VAQGATSLTLKTKNKMPFNKINTTLTGAQTAALQAAIDALQNAANLPVKFNLTKTERSTLQNLSNERYPFAQRSVQIHAPNYPQLVTGNAGTLAEAANDFNFFNQMQTFINQLEKVIEIYRDTQQVAGSECYTWMRELYRNAKAAAENNVPGSDSVADDLAPLLKDRVTMVQW